MSQQLGKWSCHWHWHWLQGWETSNLDALKMSCKEGQEQGGQIISYNFNSNSNVLLRKVKTGCYCVKILSKTMVFVSLGRKTLNFSRVSTKTCDRVVAKKREWKLRPKTQQLWRIGRRNNGTSYALIAAKPAILHVTGSSSVIICLCGWRQKMTSKHVWWRLIIILVGWANSNYWQLIWPARP